MDEKTEKRPKAQCNVHQPAGRRPVTFRIRASHQPVPPTKCCGVNPPIGTRASALPRLSHNRQNPGAANFLTLEEKVRYATLDSWAQDCLRAFCCNAKIE